MIAFKVTPWEAVHQYQCIVHPSKQFWNWFCGMVFRAAIILLLMSSKCPIFPLSLGTEKCHWGLDLVNQEGVPAQLFVY
jgi:hypothetical protein